MGGDMPQKVRIQAALALIKNIGFLSKEDKNTLEAVLYVLAAKRTQRAGRDQGGNADDAIR